MQLHLNTIRKIRRRNCQGTASRNPIRQPSGIIVDSSVWFQFFSRRPGAAGRVVLLSCERRAIYLAPAIIQKVLQDARNAAQLAEPHRTLVVFPVCGLPDARASAQAVAALYARCHSQNVTIRSLHDRVIAEIAIEFGQPVMTLDLNFFCAVCKHVAVD